MKLIMENWNNFINEGESRKISFTTLDTGHETTIEFLGMETKYDQTKVTLKFDNEEEEEELFAYDIDSLVDSIYDELSENYDGYWFLDEDNIYSEKYIEPFRKNLKAALNKLGVDPSKDSEGRDSYRRMNTGLY